MPANWFYNAFIRTFRPAPATPAAAGVWRIHDQPFNGQWYIFPACGGRLLVTVEGDRAVAEEIVTLHNRSLAIQ